MRRLAILTSVLLVASFILSDGCKKKEEDKVLNKITVAGNTNTEVNGDYFPEAGIYYAAYLTSCNITMYNSSFAVNFTGGSGIYVYINHPTTSVTIPTGTIQAQTSSECAEGLFGYFYPGQAKYAGYTFTSGTITISITDSIYNVDINLNIDVDSGGGTLTGNFNGAMTEGTNR